ncbi:two-CW domain-containing protein [Chloroflexota bacterium]
MDSKEFTRNRCILAKTQNQLAKILCVSPKAIQSFEQGWRNIPSHIERELLLLISLKTCFNSNIQPCWEIKDCPDRWREKCIVWELQVMHFCWFVNGTFCQGKEHQKWAEKIEFCKECEVFSSMLPSITSPNLPKDTVNDIQK